MSKKLQKSYKKENLYYFKKGGLLIDVKVEDNKVKKYDPEKKKRVTYGNVEDFIIEDN